MTRFLGLWDWLTLGGFLAVMAVVGFLCKKRSEKSIESFFATGRSLPWWIAGTSMAASAISIDTPLYVTETVRTQGIQGNWQWWSLGVAHVLAATLMARLWRRAGVLTEVELSELRYDGRGAAVLRGTKAAFFAIPLNCLALGGLSLLAFMTVFKTVFDLPAGWALAFAWAIALVYTAFSGMWGIVITDCIELLLAMSAGITLAVAATGKAGGLTVLLDRLGDRTVGASAQPVLGFLPASWDVGDALWTAPWLVFAFYGLCQWWGFKNADGGGVIVQRMVACRDERHAVLATGWFVFVHYALRTWPWVMAGLATLILYPTASEALGGHQGTYPRLIIDCLPLGARGFVMCALLVGFLSTVDQQLNWGASYLTHDLYRRFVRPKATDRHCIWISRAAMVLLLAGASAVALMTDSVKKNFEMILLSQMGTGAIYLLRWFWWRVNAWTELAAITTGPVTTAVLFAWEAHSGIRFPFVEKNLIILGATGIVCAAVLLLTRPPTMERLCEFYRRVRPPGPGWARVRGMLAPEERQVIPMGPAVAAWLSGSVAVYAAMAAIGKACLLQWSAAAVCGAAAVAAGLIAGRFAWPAKTPETRPVG